MQKYINQWVTEIMPSRQSQGIFGIARTISVSDVPPVRTFFTPFCVYSTVTDLARFLG
ncbi:MAG: hypothetical protein ACP5G4_12295 [bacterium]